MNNLFWARGASLVLCVSLIFPLTITSTEASVFLPCPAFTKNSSAIFDSQALAAEILSVQTPKLAAPATEQERIAVETRAISEPDADDIVALTEDLQVLARELFSTDVATALWRQQTPEIWHLGHSGKYSMRVTVSQAERNPWIHIAVFNTDHSDFSPIERAALNQIRIRLSYPGHSIEGRFGDENNMAMSTQFDLPIPIRTPKRNLKGIRIDIDYAERPKGVLLLDMGNVLLRIDPARVIHRLISEAGMPEALAAKVLYPGTYRWKLGVVKQFEEKGRWDNNPRGFYVAMKQRLHLQENLSYEEFITIWNSVFDEALAPGMVNIKTIRAFQEAGYLVVGVSNTNGLHLAHVWKQPAFFEILSALNGFFSSHTLGIAKPDLRFYSEVARQVAERWGVMPEHRVFVDDSQANVDAAKAAGWTAFRLNPEEGYRRGDLLPELAEYAVRVGDSRLTENLSSLTQGPAVQELIQRLRSTASIARLEAMHGDTLMDDIHHRLTWVGDQVERQGVTDLPELRSWFGHDPVGQRAWAYYLRQELDRKLRENAVQLPWVQPFLAHHHATLNDVDFGVHLGASVMGSGTPPLMTELLNSESANHRARVVIQIPLDVPKTAPADSLDPLENIHDVLEALQAHPRVVFATATQPHKGPMGTLIPAEGVDPRIYPSRTAVAAFFQRDDEGNLERIMGSHCDGLGWVAQYRDVWGRRGDQPGNLAGKEVVLLGGWGGMGQAISVQLFKSEAHRIVISTSMNPGSLERVKAEVAAALQDLQNRFPDQHRPEVEILPSRDPAHPERDHPELLEAIHHCNILINATGQDSPLVNYSSVRRREVPVDAYEAAYRKGAEPVIWNGFIKNCAGQGAIVHNGIGVHAREVADQVVWLLDRMTGKPLDKFPNPEAVEALYKVAYDYDIHVSHMREIQEPWEDNLRNIELLGTDSAALALGYGFVAPENGVDTVEQVIRALVPGGWAYLSLRISEEEVREAMQKIHHAFESAGELVHWYEEGYLLHIVFQKNHFSTAA